MSRVELSCKGVRACRTCEYLSSVSIERDVDAYGWEAGRKVHGWSFTIAKVAARARTVVRASTSFAKHPRIERHTAGSGMVDTVSSYNTPAIHR